MMLDILISGGCVLDGTGRPRFRSDVGIKGDRITALSSKISENAERVIDAEGLIVSPGFIDTHSHSDTKFATCRTVDCKVMQGVTTEIVGMDGSSCAPLRGAARAYVELAGIEDPTWRSFREFLDYLDNPGLSLNVASLVGHNTLRLCGT